MTIRHWMTGAAAAALMGGALPALAHFQMIIPSDDMVSGSAERQLSIDLKFWHPFEGHGMEMAKPARFGVMRGEDREDLMSTLKSVAFTGTDGKKHPGYKASYALKKPGDHLFFVEPQPYWEPSEETFIVHYTKAVVNGFGMEDGWDHEVGLKAEIVPLTRPYGLYAGNVFQGVVKLDGKPVPNATVEVEYFNEGGKLKAPADPLITQVIKADANGVFTYAMPRAGWWGFAALMEGDERMSKDGKDYPMELGAVLWVKAYSMK